MCDELREMKFGRTQTGLWAQRSPRATEQQRSKERIVNIDWNGDEYDGIPHVYCRFSSKSKEPYEELVFCEKRELDDQVVCFSDIAKLEDVQRLSRTRGVELYA